MKRRPKTKAPLRSDMTTLIEQFVADLKALAPNGKIPRDLKNLLLRELRASQRARGRPVTNNKRDHEIVEHFLRFVQGKQDGTESRNISQFYADEGANHNLSEERISRIIRASKKSGYLKVLRDQHEKFLRLTRRQ